MMGWFCVFVLLFALQVHCQVDQEDLKQFLQPDNVGDLNGTSGFGRGKRCDRTCVVGGKPLLCYYKFIVEDYTVLGAACRKCPAVASDCLLPQCVTADGYERGIYTINRRMPSPSIQVCLGDRIVIDVLNMLPGKTTTLHFHGVLQEGTNSMDGVPFVTQCPITEGATFRYNFLANSEGTHFYHSHDGLQKMDGLQGQLIIRRPKSGEPNAGIYDFDLPEHVMLIGDWNEVDGDQKFPGSGSGAGQEPTSYLVNGKGKVTTMNNRTSSLSRGFIGDLLTKCMSSAAPTPPPPTTPPAVFTVTRGRRYRFRMIGGTCLHCPAEVFIDKHRLRVIAVDGTPVNPVYVDKIVLLPGERYDFVVEATQGVSAYWIHVRGVGPCKVARAYQLAVLRYRGSRLQEPVVDPGYDGVQATNVVELNPVDGKCGPNDKNVCIPQLVASHPVNPRLLATNPDVRVVLGFDFYFYTIKELFQTNTYHRFLHPISPPPDPFKPPPSQPLLVSGFINNISNVMPSSPILSQGDDIPQSAYCDASANGFGGCKGEHCECFHLLRFPNNTLVEMILSHVAREPDGLTHPFHIHGHKFTVMKVSPKPYRGPTSREITTPGGDKRRRRSASNITASEFRRAIFDDVYMEGGREAVEGQESGENDSVEKRVAKEAETEGSKNPKGKRFPSKDTVMIPSGGHVVTRFIADNPGYWSIHCHFIYHQVVGMNLVMQVGDKTNIPATPPGFPKCGDFANKVDTSPYA